MSTSSQLPRRRNSLRLSCYDYASNGYYFVTICTDKRKILFGNIYNNQMILSDLGRIAENQWKEIPKHYSNITLDEFIVMPNHIHGIIVINKQQDNNSPSLSTIVGGYKSGCTRIANSSQSTPFLKWQRSYYERVIRNEYEFGEIQRYIQDNPMNWKADENNLTRVGQAQPLREK